MYTIVGWWSITLHHWHMNCKVDLVCWFGPPKSKFFLGEGLLLQLVPKQKDVSCHITRWSELTYIYMFFSAIFTVSSSSEITKPGHLYKVPPLVDLPTKKVARLRDLALVSIDDAEDPPFDASERICSAAKELKTGVSVSQENGRRGPQLRATYRRRLNHLGWFYLLFIWGGLDFSYFFKFWLENLWTWW